MIYHEEVTIGTPLGATVTTDKGHTMCNVLIDTIALRSFIGEKYHQKLMLSNLKHFSLSQWSLHEVAISNLLDW